MISLKKQFVLAAATVLLAACGGGSNNKPVSNALTDPDVQALISSQVQQGFRYDIAPTSTTVTVTVGSNYKEGLKVLAYRCAEEKTLDDGSTVIEAAACDSSKVQLPGDLVGFGMTNANGQVIDADGKAQLDLIVDTGTSVMVEVLDGPVKLEYQGKPYRIVQADQLGTLAF